MRGRGVDNKFFGAMKKKVGNSEEEDGKLKEDSEERNMKSTEISIDFVTQEVV